MKKAINIILLNTVPILCIIGAIILLALEIEDGWGWLLFIAFVSLITIKD